MSMTNHLAFGAPESGIRIRMPASNLVWGRIIGRVNLGTLRKELREMGQTIVLVSDTSGLEVTFRWNGIKQPFVRGGGGKQPPPYGEWLSISTDEKLSKLKIHVDGLAYRRPAPVTTFTTQ
jgi:hypothetical protein